MSSGKSRKGLYIGAAVALLVAGGVAGLATLKGAGPDVDPSKLTTVEVGTMVKSVVATGKIEPITEVEIK
jgi:HlyD family secretion protein